MKSFLLSLIMLIALDTIAQSDTITSGVYNLDSLKKHSATGSNYLTGSTTDIASLKVHASTLAPGKLNHPPRALYDYEELIIIKEGSIKVNINDSSKILTAGSVAFIVAGDKQSFENVSDKPAKYYVFAFKSKGGADTTRGRIGGGSFMKDFKEFTVKKTDKGESRPVFDRPSSMYKRFDIHATLINPGFESHPVHTHRAEEIVFMMDGNGTMHINDQFTKTSPGDIVLVRPFVPHNFKNTGTTPCWYFAIQWHNE